MNKKVTSNVIVASPPTVHAFTDLNAYKDAVFENLVGLGLSRPFAKLSVDQESRWLEVNWLTKSVEEAASGMFGAEVDLGKDGYRDAVGLFLDTYALGTGHTEAVLDAHKATLETAHRSKLPPWAVAADLLYKAPKVRPYVETDADDPRVFLDLPEVTREMLDDAATLKLLGNTADDVVVTLINQGLLALVRDGILKLPIKRNGSKPGQQR